MDVTATEFIKTSSDIAEFFGFKKADGFKKPPRQDPPLTKITHTASAQDRKVDALHGLLTSGITTYCDAQMYHTSAPVLFYSLDKVPRSGDAALSLQVYGVEKSIAEAILIQTTSSLLRELGHKDFNVRINSLGDKDSSTRYIRELTNYFRKRMDELPLSARELMKEHVFDALMHLVEKEHELAYKCPSPLEYLSDTSRKHFRDIIEYLDMSETPYEIDPKLIGHFKCYSDALFAIDIRDEQGMPAPHAPVYVRGGRYNEFTERYTKTRIPAAGAVVVLRDKKAPVRTPSRNNNPVPSVYVVQLGFGPKVQSLLLVDTLRQHNVPTYQNLACDSLSTQLREAESLGVRYTVIIGQKEYVEGTVILRDMLARNQEHVPFSDLPQKLKRIAYVS